MTNPTQLFRFAQVELPWRLGPPDGRYPMRDRGGAEATPTHVIVFTTLGAQQRRLLAGRRSRRDAEPEPSPEPVTTGRATVIEASRAMVDADEARAWLAGAGEEYLASSLEVLNRALHAFRLATADAAVHPVARAQAIAARVGYGAGEEVADGRWTQARALSAHAPAHRRAARAAITPQAELAAVLTARRPALACEELTLRARADLDHGRPREAALQLLIALDATLAELPSDPVAARIGERLAELRGRRDAVGAAAQAALAGPLGDAEIETVTTTLERIEAALRARALAVP